MIDRDAEVWIEALDDYFSTTGIRVENQSIFARLHLISEAKLWWKQWCRDTEVTEESRTWQDIKKAVKECYLPPSHESIKMNEFFNLK